MMKYSFLFLSVTLLLACNNHPVTPKKENPPIIDSTQKQVYQCPMHSSVTSQSKDQCTECGMDLELVK